jgi:DNA-binding transcriptional MerR regulator
MLKIGEFARLAQVSVKLLRYYDEIGLLPPHKIDSDTGYRYYRVSQLSVLNRLLIYRSLGFSLNEIRRLVRLDAAPADLRSMLETHRTTLAARVEAERSRLAELEARIAQIEREGRTPRYEVAIRNVDPAAAVSLRRTCESYDDVGKLLRTIRSSLPSSAAIKGYGAIWHRCIARHGDIECEALVFLDPQVRPRSTDNALIRLPACTIASVIHDEVVDDVPLAYRAAVERADALGYRVAGPMREIYFEEFSAEFTVTEVQFPLVPRHA